MPKPRRESTARADTRPAFARPPGVRAAPIPDDDNRTPRRTPKEKAKQSPALSPAGKPWGSGQKRKVSTPVKPGPTRDRVKYSSGTSIGSASHLLSADSLGKLNSVNEKIAVEEKYQEQKRQKKQYKNLKTAAPAQQRRKKKKNRDVSGAILEEGRGNEKRPNAKGRQGRKDIYTYKKKHNHQSRGSNRKCWIVIGILVLLLIILVPVAIVLSKKKSPGSSATASDVNNSPTNTCDGSNTPATAKGTYTDVSTWLDTTDFNCTYTSQTVGGLSVMGLQDSWDDSTQANANVPRLDQKWSYGQMPIRGVNLGGWLSLEPFITPSMFNYPAADNIVDEWTLTTKLGSSASSVLETHYASFVTKQTFVDIQNAGLDHVRMPFPYWAVTTYPGDPYLAHTSWRYLLRAIEWARQCGLRVNLDLHALPGSQNGWAHSGHQGSIDWLMGTDGSLNGQRSLDVQNQLSQFFAQDRYKNVVTIYGLVNEPNMLVIPVQSVLDWSTQVINIVRKNGIQQYIAFGDGFLKLTSWSDMFHGVDTKLVMDTHQYQIFNVPQLSLTHQDKINLACSGWSSLMTTANNPSTG